MVRPVPRLYYTSERPSEMKVLIFNGANDRHPNSSGTALAKLLEEKIGAAGATVSTYHLHEGHIPFFDMHLCQIPFSVEVMTAAFRQADVHIWLTPLYHGGMAGAMKNCLDWLEITSKDIHPYLTGKTVGLVCWADGLHALQGINAMDAVAKSLRAWVLPYTLPLPKQQLFGDPAKSSLQDITSQRFDKMISLLLQTDRATVTDIL